MAPPKNDPFLFKASNPSEVEAFLDQLDHPQKELVLATRKLIRATTKEIGEEIAWNAPAFFYTGKIAPFKPKEYKRHIVVFNLFKKDCLRLIFLQGASVADLTAILEGDYKDGRRIVSLHSMQELQQKKKDLQLVLKALLAQLK